MKGFFLVPSIVLSAVRVIIGVFAVLTYVVLVCLFACWVPMESAGEFCRRKLSQISQSTSLDGRNSWIHSDDARREPKYVSRVLCAALTASRHASVHLRCSPVSLPRALSATVLFDLGTDGAGVVEVQTIAPAFLLLDSALDNDICRAVLLCVLTVRSGCEACCGDGMGRRVVG